jgi:hypothetical protein
MLKSRQRILPGAGACLVFLLVALGGWTASSQTLTDGGIFSGTIAANTTNSYTFTANSGDSVVVRVGELTSSGNFDPWLQVYGPDGMLAGSGTVAGATAEEVALTATNGGTFTVLVSDGNYGGFSGSGNYELNYVTLPGDLVVSSGDEGGPMINGELNTGKITIGDLDAWTFTAKSGDSVVVRVGELTSAGNFDPWLRVYGPDGVLAGSGTIAGATTEEVALTATNGGTFTVLVSDGNYGGFSGTGTYELNYVTLPGELVVSSGDEGGPMTNGELNMGKITIGDLDGWTFTANVGDSVVVRVGELTSAGNFDPWLRIYGPDGVLVGSGTIAGATTEEVALTATNGGTFTVLVSDGNYGGYDGTGTYELNYVTLPGDLVVSSGDDGGPMINGESNEGKITIGDLDGWTFTANPGDSVVVRVGELTSAGNFDPWLRVYGPDGVLAGSGTVAGDTTEEVALTATNGGTFTVLVSDGNYGGSGGTGTYELNYVTLPGSLVVSSGDEGGPMVDGELNMGKISIGDLDGWTFTANPGDSVVVRVGELTSAGNFDPWLRIYGPDGVLVGSGTIAGAATEEVALTATNGGTFTVLVSDGNYGGSGGTGTYQLTYFTIPGTIEASSGDNGGVLTNGTLNAGTIGVGDIDGWNFTAQAGDSVILRMAELTSAGNFDPWLRVYGPDGALIGPGVLAGVDAAEFAFTPTNSGTFSVLLSDGNYGGSAGTGTYQLSYIKVPGSFVVSPGDEGGNMTNGVVYSGTNSLGDLDVWSFYGTPGDSNIFRIGTTNFTPWLRLYGPDGSLVTQAFTANTGNRTNSLPYVVTNGGIYTLVSSAYYVTQSGTYNLKQSRVPPDLIVPGTQIINEGDTLNVPITAQDPDVPIQPLTFAAVQLPTGAVFSQGGPTNASIIWATTEVSGPSTNLIVATVTDVVNGKAFTRTNSFTVVVNEINEPPQLSVPATQTINELTPLSVSATATDPDIPANALTFSLIAFPTGMTIDPTTGAISWLPTEAQGPSSNLVTVVVTDSNPWAVNSQHLSDTNSFTVLVNEVNTPPQITVPGNQTINELTTLAVSASATDSDIPANPLTFSLLNAPSGMIINPSTGAISWTPTEAEGPSANTITVVVTDSNPVAVNAQRLSATNTFTVTVNEVNTAPQLTVPATQTIDELTPLSATASATDSDIPANPLTFTLLSGPTNMTINATTGALSWTPTEAQGPSTNVIEVVVTDSNLSAVNDQHLSATNSFNVIVNEVNTAPQLTLPPTQTIDELTPLTASASATDSDIPANPLTFTLLASPTNMTINTTNGAISWIPTEAQGPSTNSITVVVTDSNPAAVNDQHLSATNSFTVIVNEVNTAPQLTVPATQTLNELTPLNVSASATDSDIPVNPLTFSLVAAPTNMTIDAASGAITWIPTEAQGPSSNTITVVVTDSNPAAVNDQRLSATNSFIVVVNEVNSKPVLQTIAGQTAHLGSVLTVQAVATDSDIPSNTLTFSLTASPANMTITPAGGLITWSPSQTQTGSFTVTVQVTDNGVPPLSDTTSFQVTVTGQAPYLQIIPLGSGLMQLTITGDTGFTYEIQNSQDVINWSNLLQFNLTTSPYPYVDPASPTNAHRFYRLKLIP